MNRSADRQNEDRQIPGGKALFLSFSPLQFSLNSLTDELSHALLAYKLSNPVPLGFRKPDLGLFDA